MFMIKMNIKSFASVLLLGLPLRMVVAADVPKSFSLARSQPMMDRSPFAVATAVTAPSGPPNFAKDLYVANAAKAKEGDLVTIASSTDKNFKKYLTTNASVDGYSISRIEWSDKVGATKVTIAKDDQLATLSFNEALLHQPGAPGQNPVPPSAIQPPQAQDRNGAGPSTLSTNGAVQPSLPTVPGVQQNVSKPKGKEQIACANPRQHPIQWPANRKQHDACPAAHRPMRFARCHSERSEESLVFLKSTTQII